MVSHPNRLPGRNVIDLTNENDAPPPPTANQSIPISIIDTDSEDEDEELKRAIALSLQHQEEEEVPVLEVCRASTPSHESTRESTLTFAVPVKEFPPVAASTFSGLDRKQMEAERLERLKRKRAADDAGEKQRPVSPPPLRRLTQASRSTNPQSGIGFTPPPTSINEATALQSSAQPSHAYSSIELPYPNGTTFQTPAPGGPSTTKIPSLTFASLIASPISQPLQVALLSSYTWNFDWLFTHFPTKTTNFLLVMQAKYTPDRTQIQSDFKGISNIRLCFPPMDGQVNCMHSKLMILFYGGQGRCRIIVPTGNLVGYDWGVGEVMENSGWCIDLPLLPQPILRPTPETQTPFHASLVTFLTAQLVPKDILTQLARYDFSQTRKFGFVHSIGGSHTQTNTPSLSTSTKTDAWRTTGHPLLGTTLTHLNLNPTAPSAPIQLDYITSSLGSLTPQFLRSIYLAASGDDGLSELTLRTAKTLPARRLAPNAPDDISNKWNLFAPKEMVRASTGAEYATNFRFYYPSAETVENSCGGEEAAGTVCFVEKWWDGPKFPRAGMRDCVSVRGHGADVGGMLMHNKIIYARFPRPQQVEHVGPCIGWTYIGSANLSESAWGRLVLDNKTKAPKLNCRNWECGVVIPVADRKDGLPTTTLAVSGKGGGLSAVAGRASNYINDQEKAVQVDGGSLDGFAETAPVPMRFPGAAYERAADMRPWFFSGGL